MKEAENIKKIDQLGKILWRYHLLGQKIHTAKVIIVMGSSDTRVAEWASDVFLQGFAPKIIFSGERGRLTSEWDKTEAEVFRDVALERGVPADAILLEPKSSNSGDNIRFSKKLMAEKGISDESVIVITKPYMERRAYSIAKMEFPESDVVISSAPVTYEEYAASAGQEKLINQMVGDLERIIEYPKLGHQLPQDVPVEVLNAFKKLIDAGYTKSLIKK